MRLGCNQCISAGSGMGYGYFKTTQDGSRLFFPWAMRGPGYVMASEQDCQHLRQQLKLYSRATLTVAVAVGVAAVYFSKIDSLVFILIVVFLADMFYTAWIRRLLPRLKVSNETLSLREWWSGTLKALKPIGPWTVQDPSVTSSRVSR